MSEFRRRLVALDTTEDNRSWVYVPYDQLSDAIGPLASEPPASLGIVLVESSAKAARRPYHRQKLALLLANQRHFALEQARRGVAVEYVMSDADYAGALGGVIERRGPLRVMEPAEWELRRELQRLFEEGGLEQIPHEGWLTTVDQFASISGPPWRMDAFYRLVRRESGLLMKDGKPLGGKFSFDAENRRAWHGDPEAPEPPDFSPGAVTREVGDLIEERFASHPGRLRLSALPATRADAERLWSWALERCLPHFGPYEDAMSAASSSLFHTRISGLMNLHRLLPSRVVAEVAEANVSLASREGFVRQILGWREFMRHVHRATDGFRLLPDLPGSTAAGPSETTETTETSTGDGGWSRWAGTSWRDGNLGDLAGAEPAALAADGPLPPAFWGSPSGLRCLDHIVGEVWDEGYTHHIPRLMVLANLATLLGVAPREVTDWFWAAFIDAFDWVVEPNVLGMGTFAAGELLTTKPYVAGANYINRMSDYCKGCRFDPRRSCPITRLYWAFLDRNRERLQGNHRLSLILGGSRRRSEKDRLEDRRVFDDVRLRLARAEELEAPTG